MTATSLYDSAAAFAERLGEIKASLNAPFAWYPYNTLANIEHLDKLLEGGSGALPALLEGGVVLDLGCADGDWAFFLESLGCRVHAIDCPITNQNGMAGVHALKEALGSSVEIHAADLDGRFTLPSREYALAFFFGTLYHLKNPYYVLEELSRAARYCLLSTRVARNFHARLGDVADLPLAYLLAADELNADPSNFWIFSPSGLRRLLKRTNWTVLSYYSAGETNGSTPWSLQADERMFCFAESTYGFPGIDLLGGWHEPEDSGWRWTAREFSACLEAPKGGGHMPALVMEMYVPGPVLAAHGPLTLSAEVDGHPLPEERLHREGFHTYLRALPSRFVHRPRITVRFRLDKATPPDDQDRRERGLIVASLKLQRRS